MKSFFVFLILFFSFLPPLIADTVITKDGDSYYGKVISEDGEEVVLEMKIGTIKFHKNEVASIEKSPPEEITATEVQAPSAAPAAAPPAKKGDWQPVSFEEQQRIRKEQQEKLRSIYQEMDEKRRQFEESKKKEKEAVKEKKEETTSVKASQEKPPASVTESKAAETESKPAETEKKSEPQPSQDITIKPTIRGLPPDQYKTY